MQIKKLRQVFKRNTPDIGIDKVDNTNVEEVIDRDSIHAIYPFSFEIYPTYVQSGENFIRVLAVAEYPNKTHGNWMSELRRKKANINIIQFINSSSSSYMIDYYRKTITNKEAELMKYNDPYKRKMLQKELDSADMQLNKYLDEQVSFVYQYTYIYLRADSLKELDNLTENTKNTLIKLQLNAITPVKAMSQAFWSTMPIGENLLPEYTYKESNTEAASSMIPFDDGEILDLKPCSDIKGTNKDTGSLVAINMMDKYKTLNQNTVIIGTSGTGKTTAIIQQIFKCVIMGFVVYIIDPDNEYSHIVKLLGGEVVHLSSNASSKINPLQIFSNEIFENEDKIEKNKSTAPDMERLVKDKIQRVKGFLEVIKNDISQVEKAVMDDIIKQAYINRGIYKYHSINDIQSDQWPILSDVVKEMASLKSKDPAKFKKVEDLYYILESYTKGSNTLFDGYTTINIKNNLISFDLKPLQNEKEIQKAAYLNTFQFLWDEFTKDRTRIKRLFVDEFHFLTKDPEGAAFFYQAYKRFRKYNAGAIAGTQQIEDVIEGQAVDGKNIGAAIIGNSYTQMFFGLDNSDVDSVIKKLGLKFSDKEKKFLSKKRQGEAIIRYGSQRAFIKIELTEEELRLVNPKEYKKIYQRTNLDQPDYEKRINITEREERDIEQYVFQA